MPQPAQHSQLYRNFIFDGSHGILTKLSLYSLPFQCKFNLVNYPFDVQRCTLEMRVFSPDLSEVELVPMPGSTTASSFEFADYSMTMADLSVNQSSATLYFSMKLKRNVQPMIPKVFLPVILLNIISQVQRRGKGGVPLLTNSPL